MSSPLHPEYNPADFYIVQARDLARQLHDAWEERDAAVKRAEAVEEARAELAEKNRVLTENLDREKTLRCGAEAQTEYFLRQRLAVEAEVERVCLSRPHDGSQHDEDCEGLLLMIRTGVRAA